MNTACFWRTNHDWSVELVLFYSMRARLNLPTQVRNNMWHLVQNLSNYMVKRKNKTNKMLCSLPLSVFFLPWPPSFAHHLSSSSPILSPSLPPVCTPSPPFSDVRSTRDLVARSDWPIGHCCHFGPHHPCARPIFGYH